ncbi:glyoxalase/bleomycin resistance protein/dioxygenase [Mycolicibacterium canariasense]|uniref:Glyoxalase/bleomycin resistance protein/dioxygenase n=1 Tax=Mycolicibacterium canariasense TaxID=228230 RepID=A0A100WFJ2_MYCCR|nr:VOC family protein [Mycolicibacterium canariasense]MCV7211271.1 VOC family protein [Mycolicibacterium canariasense]ORV03325.1 glyoxalase [Mycolicibacterium canariasense]GAS97156.1 glyoxalase/bleomycin resistance protein/dioxygenase [Mycolicibacterium canariasense]
MNNSRDPLTALYGDDLPVTPDPAFAARLRARLVAALSLPPGAEGVEMSGTDSLLAELAEPAPPGTGTVIPYLAVADARAALDWYAAALGAEVVGAPVVMDDGRIGHAELSVAGATVYLADEYPELGLRAPAPQSVSVSLLLRVADTDATLRRARARGARVQREPYEDHGARNAAIVDPFGHRWMLAGPRTGAAVTIRHGDVGYVSVNTPDAARAAAFYAHVLGWSYEGNHVTGTGLSMGIHETPGPSTLFCCYAVDDLDAARAAITAAGGTAGQPQDREFGTVLDATDPLGTPFAVYHDTAGTPRPALNGTGPGELSYITYEVPDSAEFKAFYGRVLNWSFEPGRVEDGWGVLQTHPMAGAAGGARVARTVPMWTVADIDSAVTRVREAGGSVIEEPSSQSYGMSALCTDDQGARFYLGEH